MRMSQWLLVAPLAVVAGAVLGIAPGHAEPLTPLTWNEIQYLDGLRKVFAANHDPAAFRSDGELLTDGHFVCAKSASGQVGWETTFKTPAVTQLAFIYLCP